MNLTYFTRDNNIYIVLPVIPYNRKVAFTGREQANA